MNVLYGVLIVPIYPNPPLEQSKKFIIRYEFNCKNKNNLSNRAALSMMCRLARVFIVGTL